jgi:hypothetical protein
VDGERETRFLMRSRFLARRPSFGRELGKASIQNGSLGGVLLSFAVHCSVACYQASKHAPSRSKFIATTLFASRREPVFINNRSLRLARHPSMRSMFSILMVLSVTPCSCELHSRSSGFRHLPLRTNVSTMPHRSARFQARSAFFSRVFRGLAAPTANVRGRFRLDFRDSMSHPRALLPAEGY